MIDGIIVIMGTDSIVEIHLTSITNMATNVNQIMSNDHKIQIVKINLAVSDHSRASTADRRIMKIVVLKDIDVPEVSPKEIPVGKVFLRGR